MQEPVSPQRHNFVSEVDQVNNAIHTRMSQITASLQKYETELGLLKSLKLSHKALLRDLH